jgi:hypothetical protein
MRAGNKVSQIGKMTWSTRILPFTIPVALFLASSLIAPSITLDSAKGFSFLRSMLEGSGFNYVLSPDRISPRGH